MVNFRMWKTALSTIPQVSPEEWERLDVISRYLVMTRSAVATVTIFSSIVAGLLAWRSGEFSLGIWLIVTLGLFLAHGANNILNDYVDYVRGVDTDNYFRTMYGPHPLVHGFHDTRTQLRYFAVSGVLALIAGLYTLYYTDFDHWVLVLIAIGAFFLLLYTFPLKHMALGEFSIFLIWGPVMIGGVYYVLTRQFDWNVILTSIPVGLSVMSINLGKHIDKSEDDRSRRVTTLPVLIGERVARTLNFLVLVGTYGVILYLIFGARFFSPVMLIVFLAGKQLFQALVVLWKPKPESPPEGFTAWPVWFSAFLFVHNRRFIALFMAGLVLDTALRVFLPR